MKFYLLWNYVWNNEFGDVTIENPEGLKNGHHTIGNDFKLLQNNLVRKFEKISDQ